MYFTRNFAKFSKTTLIQILLSMVLILFSIVKIFFSHQERVFRATTPQQVILHKCKTFWEVSKVDIFWESHLSRGGGGRIIRTKNDFNVQLKHDFMRWSHLPGTVQARPISMWTTLQTKTRLTFMMKLKNPVFSKLICKYIYMASRK